MEEIACCLNVAIAREDSFRDKTLTRISQNQVTYPLLGSLGSHQEGSSFGSFSDPLFNT